MQVTVARRAPGLARMALAWAMTLAAVACQAVASGGVIDGFAIGDRYDCWQRSANEADECRAYIRVATAALDRRDPGHAPIVSVALHEQLFVGEDGVPRLAVCSGGCMSVAVFRLMDGSLRAIAVGTPGIATEPMAIDYGTIEGPTPR